MKATFTVTVEGTWYDNGRPVTAAIIERELRKTAKDRFEFLADRVTVSRIKVGQARAQDSAAGEKA